MIANTVLQTAEGRADPAAAKQRARTLTVKEYPGAELPD
jgi:hypothetical protein